MTLKLRFDRHLPGAYHYLSLTEPFSTLRPRIPEAEAVRFIVTLERHNQGKFSIENRIPEISVSRARTGHTLTLMGVMAHEMLHLYQWRAKTTTKNTEHNAEFRRLAHLVCRAHGFDFNEFIGLGA